MNPIVISTATPKNRAAPADPAELAAEQRTDRDAQPERGLVDHHRAGYTATGGPDDSRQGGRNEQRVAEAPSGPQADDRADAVRKARERAEYNDQRQPGEQRALDPNSAGHARDEHRQSGDGEVAGEQELDVARGGVQAGGDRRQDRVDQSEPHERDDGGKRDRPDGGRLRTEEFHAMSSF
jgi:hypothetical protein